MNMEKIKQSICKIIDENSKEIIKFSKSVESEPELGFK